MIPKSVPSDLIRGGRRLSEKIMLKQKDSGYLSARVC
jgi:hypothetical protein